LFCFFPDPGPRTPDPGLTGTRERLGAAVAALADGLPDRAVELLDQALLADPADAVAHGLEGFIHDVSGRTQMAVPSYRAALFLDPALFQVRLLLADALRRLGNSARAALEYREVMATLAAGTSQTADALARLQLPDAAQARERCREALVGRSS
jgi:tetratricopeptide (TPR) repeat protein